MNRGAHFSRGSQKLPRLLLEADMTEQERSIEALEQLVRVAMEIPPDGLDMSSWSHVFPECRTTHCIAGWLRLDSWFLEHTLIKGLFEQVGEHIYPVHGFLSNEVFYTLLGDVVGIRTGDARYLFGLAGERSPQTVPELIRFAEALIERKREEMQSGVMTHHFGD